MNPSEHPVVLFDGVCNLCDRTVRFIIDHDPTARFRFASQQSAVGAALLKGSGFGALGGEGLDGDRGPADSVILIERGRAFVQSTAVLRILPRLAGPCRMMAVLWVVPRPLRDLGYRFIARNRYRWFGRSDQCHIATPEMRHRFLDSDH